MAMSSDRCPTFASLTIRLPRPQQGGWRWGRGRGVDSPAHQDARAAPAEVSHPLLTMALLAPPVTCELGNERRGGAVIYITNVRERRTRTALISPAPHQPL